MPSAPETLPLTRRQSRNRGLARLPAFAVLLVTLMGSVLPSFGQTFVSQLGGMNGPTFVALDTRGAPATTWLYVSEHGETNGTGGGRIFRFNLTSGSTTPQVVATSGTGNGQFVSPDGIVVDPATGDLFIADRFRNRVQRISVNQTTGEGSFVMGWGSSTAGAPDEMHGPLGLARDSAGAIYVAEHGDTNGSVVPNVVSKYTISGTTATRVWRRGNGFNVPYGIAVSGSSLLISDGFNARVQIWDLNGNPTGGFGIPGTIPLGLSIDSTGALWIAESSDNGGGSIQRVERRTVAGTSTGMSFGTLGSSNGQFILPFHAVVNAATNRVYVADYGNDRVQVFDLAAATPGDTTAPTIASFTAGAASGNSVPFTVTFSEPVTGVAATAFNAVGGGATVDSVTPVSSTTYTVNVNFTGASGTVTLSVNGFANTSVRDASNNFYAGGGTTSAVFTITPPTSGDTTPPTVASMALGSNNSQQNATFTVTFSEPVTGVDASDFSISRTGTTSGTVTGVTGSGTTYSVAFLYDGTSGFTGSIQLGIRTSGTGITDASGSAFLGGGVTASAPIAVNNAPVVEGVLPTVTSFTAGTASGQSVNFTLTFSEAVTGVDAADIFATRTGTATAAIGTVSGSGATYTVPVTFGGSGTIQLTVVGGVSANIRDAVTNMFAGGGSSTSGVFTLPTVGTAPVIAAQTASGTQNAAFSYQVVATGATSYSVVASALPAGLSISPSGAITGTPTASGTTVVTVRATNTNGVTDAPVTITISPAGTPTLPVIASQSATGTQNAAFSYQVVASGATGFSIAGAQALPTGLAISSSGLITGTPTAVGSTVVTVRASNTTGNSDAPLTITISSASSGGAPVITSPLVASVAANAAFSHTITATNAATAFTATGLPAGLSFASPVISGSVATPGVYNISLSASNTAGADTKTLMLTVTAPIAGVPVVTSGTINAAVGSPLTYQVVATSAPTSYSIVTGTVPTGLSMSPATGAITGTPTVAGTSTVMVRATNGFGSGTGILTFVVGSTTPPPTTPPPTTPPPTSGGGGGGILLIPQTVTFGPIGEAVINQPLTLSATSSAGLTPIVFTVLSGNASIAGDVLTPRATGAILVRATQPGGGAFRQASADATINSKSQQTITFNSPVSSVMINQPITLSATSSAGLPVTFSLVSGNATLSGNTLTPRGLGAIVVRASAAGNNQVAAASTDVNFGAPQRAAQSIAFTQPTDVSVNVGSVTLNATSSSGQPVTYALVDGPATLSGNVLKLTGVPGVVTVSARQAGTDLFNAAEITRTINVRAAGQQVYLGNMGTDPFAVVVSADGKKGVFITRFAATGEAIVAKFAIAPSGTFQAEGQSTLPASSAAATQARTIAGTVNNGTMTGAIQELSRNFTATMAVPTGTTASLAGVYIASAPGSASGETYIVVGPNGQALAVAITPLGVTSGTGTISVDGTLNITTSGGGSITGKIDANTGTLTGTLQAGTATAALVGLSEGMSRSDRLVNLSSRLRVVSGDASRSVIAGFVIAGTEPKPVLIRAVGPGLSGFGVSGTLANPRLQLYNGTTLIAENDDWTDALDTTATGDAVGAFRLNANSRDSAIVANLPPGAYTAVVTGVGGDGVALIEIYDATSNAPVTATHLVNIATRGFVETGEGNIIAGFVVTGNAPKRVLIRGIGPGLAQFNVPGMVSDPMVTLYGADSTTVVARNDNWSTPQPVDASQVPATSEEIVVASSATGAFPLQANSRDAAIIVTLMPGQYSAVVSGVSNATGAGLVEVYEVSNP